MERDEDKDDLGRLAMLIAKNTRGYQDYWAWRNKPVAETSAVREAFESAGYEIGEVHHLAEDPPDCWTMIGSIRVSIEHTELVSEEAMKLTFKTGTHHYRVWNEEGFREAIATRVAAKLRHLNRYCGEYDENWLLIVSDEFDLDALRVADWVDRQVFDLGGFAGVLLALSYHPSAEGGHTPVFRLRAQ